MKLAIRADHDGSGADLPVRWLTHDLAISPRKAREGLAELEKRGLIVTDDPGGPGRGRVARRRVIPQPCGDLARCQPCRALAELLASPEKGPQGTTRRTT